MSALHDCIEVEDVDRLTELIAEGADLEAVDVGGRTPVCCAVEEASSDVVKVLLAAGADPNTPRTKWNGEDDNVSPLIIAVSWFVQSTEIVEMLLAHGADVNYRRAVAFGKADDASALDTVCENRQWEMASLLLNAGADTSPCSFQRGLPHDVSPLMHAAHAGETELVELMLKKGADPGYSSTMFHGEPSCVTVLQWACVGHSGPDTLRLLCEWGADTNAISEGHLWRTALHMAVRIRMDNEPAISALVVAGADPFERSEDGLTTLEVGAKGSVVLLDSRPARFP